MNALDSSLEALALSYLSYEFLTAVNNIWALVAVVTTAVGFWRIRALSSSLLPMPERRQDAPSPLSSLTPPNTAAAAAVEAEAAEHSTPISAPADQTTHLKTAPVQKTECSVSERELISSKVKFSLYYNEDDDSDECDDGGEDDDNGGAAAEVIMSEKLGFWCDDWEKMSMAMRMGDFGWYRCQDLRVLDGSVVRLWDSRRTRRHATAPEVGVAW